MSVHNTSQNSSDNLYSHHHNSAFHPSQVGKWVPASAGKE